MSKNKKGKRHKNFHYNSFGPLGQNGEKAIVLFQFPVREKLGYIPIKDEVNPVQTGNGDKAKFYCRPNVVYLFKELVEYFKDAGFILTGVYQVPHAGGFLINCFFVKNGIDPVQVRHAIINRIDKYLKGKLFFATLFENSPFEFSIFSQEMDPDYPGVDRSYLNIGTPCYLLGSGISYMSFVYTTSPAKKTEESLEPYKVADRQSIRDLEALVARYTPRARASRG